MSNMSSGTLLTMYVRFCCLFGEWIFASRFLLSSSSLSSFDSFFLSAFLLLCVCAFVVRFLHQPATMIPSNSGTRMKVTGSMCARSGFRFWADAHRVIMKVLFANSGGSFKHSLVALLQQNRQPAGYASKCCSVLFCFSYFVFMVCVAAVPLLPSLM